MVTLLKIAGLGAYSGFNCYFILYAGECTPSADRVLTWGKGQ